jgi:hypothetical protein
MDIPSVQTFLGAAGACPEIAFQGKTWKIGHPTQRAKAVLEELAVSKATSEIRALKGTLPADAYGELFSELTNRISSGDYRTWGPGWQRIVFSGNNAHLFLLSLLRECHKDATEAEARALALGEPEQVQAALVRVVPGFLSLLLDGLPLSPEHRLAAEMAFQMAFNQLAETEESASAPTSVG